MQERWSRSSGFYTHYQSHVAIENGQELSIMKEKSEAQVSELPPRARDATQSRMRPPVPGQDTRQT